MRKLYKIRIEADDETIFYAHIQRERERDMARI